MSNFKQWIYKLNHLQCLQHLGKNIVRPAAILNNCLRPVMNLKRLSTTCSEYQAFFRDQVKANLHDQQSA